MDEPLKHTYVQRREEAIRHFMDDGNPARLLKALSNLVDDTIVHLAKNTPGITIIATGGYGRRELFPHSDIDLLFLHDTLQSDLQPAIDSILYPLWELGLHVGHATRTTEDCIRLAATDLTVATALLDARLITGDKPLFRQLTDRLQTEIFSSEDVAFIEGKLAERDQRHLRFGDSRYLLEPNIKDSKGALRDLHTLNWIAKYIYRVGDFSELEARGLLTAEEIGIFNRARRFLWKLRAHLHIAAGKPEERLTFDMQQRLTEVMGYRHTEPHKAVERLMKRYFLTATITGSLTRIVCALLEEERKRRPKRPMHWLAGLSLTLSGFIIEGERLTVRREEEFAEQPIRMLEIFHVAAQNGLDIHPRALQLITRNLAKIDRAFYKDQKAGNLFMQILLDNKQLETTLRRMNEVGVLGRFIPAFGRIVGQTQFNMYHIYTVDEHTIIALGNLRRLESGSLKDELPLASDIIGHISLRHVLYLALLCHDIAKGRGGDHSELGESIACQLAEQFGFSTEHAEMTAWLVRHHLLMSATAFKRDLLDPKTVTDFVALVQSPERLRLLLALTVADIRAVGPAVWNHWKGELLGELYRRAERFMQTGQLTQDEQAPESVRQSLQQLLPNIAPERIDQYIDIAPPAALSAIPAGRHAAILPLLAATGENKRPFALLATHDDAEALTELVIATPDQPGLFAKLSGALALSGANIITANIFTLKDGTALDLFTIQNADGHAFTDDKKLARLEKQLTQILADKLDIAAELAKRRASYPSRRDALLTEPQIYIENNASNLHTVIEIISRDRVGLLYHIADRIAKLGLSIASAHISTYGEKAVDVFYVKNRFGLKIEHETKLREIKRQLMEWLGSKMTV